jgi:rubrerythrin
MTSSELARAIMQDIAAQLEAVHLYIAHMEATDNEDAKKVLYDIALEEHVHVGEFTSLLYRIDPVSATKAQEGFAEVQALLGTRSPADIVPASQGGETPETVPTPQGLTVGSLKGTDAPAG